MSNYIERYWRDAKPEDAIKEPPMVARFRDKSTLQWSDAQELRGWVRKTSYGWVGENGVWAHCQVYDAPDPGEGYELIDPDSAKRVPSDERWYPAIGKWLSPDDCYCERYQTGCFYRRRITPTVTYIPFTWEDREQLRGRWIYRDKDGYIMEEIAIRFDSRAFDVVAKHLLDDGWKFLDTKKPVGKEVIQ